MVWRELETQNPKSPNSALLPTLASVYPLRSLREVALTNTHREKADDKCMERVKCGTTESCEDMRNLRAQASLQGSARTQF